ncbi:MAG: Hsp20/alpha crystallin family protein [Candidatus Helarchaeota archaeon]
MEMNEENENSFDKDKKINIEEENTDFINKVITTVGKVINDSKKRVKNAINNIKKIDFFNWDWIEILSIISNPIDMDFLIDGIPKVFYDVFDYEDDLEVIIDIPNVEKENIKITAHYKTMKIYVKNYLIEKINLSKYLKRSIKIKNINSKFEGRILKIKIKKN